LLAGGAFAETESRKQRTPPTAKRCDKSKVTKVMAEMSMRQMRFLGQQSPTRAATRQLPPELNCHMNRAGSSAFGWFCVSLSARLSTHFPPFCAG